MSHPPTAGRPSGRRIRLAAGIIFRKRFRPT